MNQNRQQTVQDLLVFALLVAIGVAGRWGQPEWCFTPTAAAAIFAGYYFSRVSIAAARAAGDPGDQRSSAAGARQHSGDARHLRGDDGAGVAGPDDGRRVSWLVVGMAVGRVRIGPGHAVLCGDELRRVGVSERLREDARRVGPLLLGRRAVLSAGCSPATCSI